MYNQSTSFGLLPTRLPLSLNHIFMCTDFHCYVLYSFHKKPCKIRAKKKTETPKSVSVLLIQYVIFIVLAIVSQIPYQYPNKPKSTGKECEEYIQNQTSRATLFLSIRAHYKIPFCIDYNALKYTFPSSVRWNSVSRAAFFNTDRSDFLNSDSSPVFKESINSPTDFSYGDLSIFSQSLPL